MTEWLAFALGIACIVLVVLPPRWDPAIRLKEWALRHKDIDK